MHHLQGCLLSIGSSESAQRYLCTPVLPTLTFYIQTTYATTSPFTSPTINFIRTFFSGARSASPNQIMSAKSKAQEIIDSNSVGEWIPLCLAYILTAITALTFLRYSCLLQVLLPLLQVRKDPPQREGRKGLHHRARPSRYVLASKRNTHIHHGTLV